MWAILALVVLLVNNVAGSVLPETRSSTEDEDHAAGSTPDPRSSIAGGDEAPVGRWPWMANLWITDGIRTWQCSGSLLTEEWVLTAAYCLTSKRMAPIPKFSFARLGTADLKDVSELYIGLSEFIKHPKYKGMHNDIALVRLQERVLFSPLVSPVRLPARGEVFWPNAECIATGWGSDDWGETIPLQQLQAPIIKQSLCRERFHGITSSLLCAGNPSIHGEACENDIGGPLVCRSTCGFVQVGVATGQLKNQMCWDFVEGTPGVYTRLAKYTNFINNVTQCNMEASSEI